MLFWYAEWLYPTLLFALPLVEALTQLFLPKAIRMFAPTLCGVFFELVQGTTSALVLFKVPSRNYDTYHRRI